MSSYFHYTKADISFQRPRRNSQVFPFCFGANLPETYRSGFSFSKWPRILERPIKPYRKKHRRYHISCAFSTDISLPAPHSKKVYRLFITPQRTTGAIHDRIPTSHAALRYSFSLPHFRSSALAAFLRPGYKKYTAYTRTAEINLCFFTLSAPSSTFHSPFPERPQFVQYEIDRRRN